MRKVVISVFVVCWIFVFHYESTRMFYLTPLFRHELPKVKFLFPPAGWIMFYNIGDSFGDAEVYGVKGGRPQRIDPHLILATRTIGYDNIYRNVLSEILNPGMAQSTCRFLRRKFPYFDSFLVTYTEYPSITKAPLEQRQVVMYECR